MKNILKFGIITFAFGLIFVSADTVNAQTTRREARRDYREEVRDARRDMRRDIRRGENRREARREFREERREARRDYQRRVRRANNGWYLYNNGRRTYYPFSRYLYRNGVFVRRY